MTPAHAYFYVHILHIFDQFVRYTALRTSLASFKMRTDCKSFHVPVALHLMHIITTLMLQQYEGNVTIL
jgi:hypothetical protein